MLLIERQTVTLKWKDPKLAIRQGREREVRVPTLRKARRVGQPWSGHGAIKGGPPAKSSSCSQRITRCRRITPTKPASPVPINPSVPGSGTGVGGVPH